MRVKKTESNTDQQSEIQRRVTADVRTGLCVDLKKIGLHNNDQ